MWEPDPEWHPLPGGLSPATLGVWRAAVGDRPVVIKRLARPRPGDPEAYSDPHDSAYWCREAEVLAQGHVARTSGLRSAAAVVEEDPDGITVTTEFVEDAANNGLFVANALGRFGQNNLRHLRHLASGQLRTRLQRVEARGGWPTLARTKAGAVTEPIWAKRHDLLDRLDALPHVLQHGDPTPSNLAGRDGDDVVAVDWSTLGYGAVGADLGLYSLSAREALEPLVEAYALGASADPAQVRLGAAVSAAYTALTRAEWALSRVDGAPGPLEAKFRHPAVAPHLRTLERFAGEVDWLIGL